jgi:hypothetical protein
MKPLLALDLVQLGFERFPVHHAYILPEDVSARIEKYERGHGGYIEFLRFFKHVVDIKIVDVNFV